MNPDNAVDKVPLITWGQGPGFYVLLRRDADMLLDLARRFNAMVWITVDRRGAPQPLLMPRRWAN